MKKQIKIPGVLICLLVLTLVLALYYCFVYTGLSQKTAQLSAQHATDMQQLSAYREMAANKPALMKSIEDLKQQAEASGSELGIPPSGLRGDLQTGLSGAGVTATGITMSDTSAGKKTPSGRTLSQVAVTITADCTEQQLSTMLHYFERGTNAVYTVNSVSMSAKDKQGKTANGQYTVTLSMTAYYLAAASSGAKS